MAWPGNADPPQCECEYHPWAMMVVIFCFPMLVGGVVGTILTILAKEVKVNPDLVLGGLGTTVFITLFALTAGKKKICATCKGNN